MNTLAAAYHASGKRPLALPLLEEVQRRSEVKLGSDHPWNLTCMTNVGVAYLEAGKLEQAALILERAAVGMERRKFEHEHAGEAIDNLATCLERVRRFAEAMTWRQKWLAAVSERSASSPAHADALFCLASNLMQQKDWSAAEPHLQASVEILKALVDEWQESVAAAAPTASLSTADGQAGSESKRRTDERRHLIEALEQMVQLYVACGKDAEAARWRQELADAKRSHG